ncbi:MAG: hypothetical protein KDM91_05090 [Verrucomicrobiae bacterium]|nr:hypothetical protein [Verrucomicrobiae bacterium]MCP5541227.1 hypothetical protein [Akkermansiaceae bacterium]MCP5551629.1 hypothetical protein [Akkermansiaceae bacterium]
MSSLSFHDIQYAMETTRVLHEPDRRIDTFGTTSFEFHLVSELMDSVNQVRVREGRIQAERPRILRPEGYNDLMFDGFGEQAEAFSEWFRQHGGDIAFLKYGFSFAARDIREMVVHDTLEAVSDRVVEEIRSNGNPLKAVIQGVDDTWEISLLKFTFEMVEKSQGINVFDFKRRGMM